MTEIRRILVVDDHRPLAENLVEILQEAGYQTQMAESAEAALRYCEHQCLTDLIITDFKLPGLNGARLISVLRSKGVTAPAVIISAYTDEHTRAEAHAAGASAILSKPVDIPQLLTRIHALSEQAMPPSST